MRAALIASVALAASPVRADRDGRVVRVERNRLAAAEVRMCPHAEDKLTCYGGSAPEADGEYVLVGLDGVRGRAQVARVERSRVEDRCRLGSAHDVYLGSIETSDGSTFQASGYVIGIRGLELERGAKLVYEEFDVAPSGRDDESVWIALDRDGDGSADAAATGRPCPEERAALPASASGYKVQAYCIGYWLRDEPEWRRVGAHVYYRCSGRP